MITSIGIPSVSQILDELRKLGVRAGGQLSSLGESLDAAMPRYAVPLLIPSGMPVLVPARWGTPNSERKTVFFCNAEGQRFAPRGIIVASYVETQSLENGETHRVKISAPDGSLLKIGAVFKPENSNGPLSCKVMLCHSVGQLAAYGRFQPVILADHHCADFLNQQRDAIFFQKADPGRSFLVEAGEAVLAQSELVLNPFGMSSNDPRYIEPATFNIPKNVVVL